MQLLTPLILVLFKFIKDMSSQSETKNLNDGVYFAHVKAKEEVSLCQKHFLDFPYQTQLYHVTQKWIFPYLLT